jgi:hypothetical protein
VKKPVTINRRHKHPDEMGALCAMCDWGMYVNGRCDFCAHREGTDPTKPAKLITVRPVKLANK